MRVIEVNEPDIFTSLYEGWLASTTDLRGLGNLRTGAKVLDALESISAPTDPKQGPFKSRELMAGGGTLYLEEAEWQMLKAALDTVSWRPVGVRSGMKALALLESPKQVSAREAHA